jgi:DNA-binding GntR family transcriptional regulator
MEGAYKASDQEILNIKKILEKTRILLSSENHKDRLILNSRFHDCLVQCSRNNKLIEIYKAQTKKFGWPKFFPSIKLPRAQKSYKDHVKIFEAFAGGDGKMVRELAEEHQKSALEIMLANLRKNTNE